jgi:hypothetical protein
VRRIHDELNDIKKGLNIPGGQILNKEGQADGHQNSEE